jgi:uncharacterized protein
MSSVALPTQDVCAAPELVHVAILRVVRPGREMDFEARIREFFEEAARQPGVCGAYLIRPIAGSDAREYGILRSFRSPEERDRFYASDLYRNWNESVGPLVEGAPRREPIHGLEAFFRHVDPPPRWKMAVLTWIGVNPAVYIFSKAVPALVPQLPLVATFLVVNALVVASLTWCFMPILARIFASWLQPKRT